MDLPRDRQTALQTLSSEVYGPYKAPEVGQIDLLWSGRDHDGVKVEEHLVATNYGAARAMFASPDGDGPFPCFVILNFHGNFGSEPAYQILGSAPQFLADHRRAFPLRQITESGFALITARYEDFFPDNAARVPSHLSRHHLPAELRAISAWAAGLSSLASLAHGLKQIDVSKLTAIGHSRLGKAALWASANDDRFAAAISIQSGCGGSAPNVVLPEDIGAERVADITKNFPHWFADRYAEWVGRETEMAFDMHWLIAAPSPRPVLLMNAADDLWANASGQLRMAEAARPAFPSPDHVQTFSRPGGHSVIEADWEEAIRFTKQMV